MAHGDVYTKMECDGCHREFMLAGDGEWGELDMLESNDWTNTPHVNLPYGIRADRVWTIKKSGGDE